MRPFPISLVQGRYVENRGALHVRKSVPSSLCATPNRRAGPRRSTRPPRVQAARARENTCHASRRISQGELTLSSTAHAGGREQNSHARRTCSHACTATPRCSATGTRTRVARVRAEYPNQLDYSGCDARRAQKIPFVARTGDPHQRHPTRGGGGRGRPHRRREHSRPRPSRGAGFTRTVRSRVQRMSRALCVLLHPPRLCLPLQPAA